MTCRRLDGRAYAVKKIKLDSASPASFARITREVATLSRLQHPNVVRYFQVCYSPGVQRAFSYRTFRLCCCLHAWMCTGPSLQ